MSERKSFNSARQMNNVPSYLQNSQSGFPNPNMIEIENSNTSSALYRINEHSRVNEMQAAGNLPAVIH